MAISSTGRKANDGGHEGLFFGADLRSTGQISLDVWESHVKDDSYEIAFTSQSSIRGDRTLTVTLNY